MLGDAIGRLTPREIEILDAVSRGRTNAQIAADLEVTVHTIKFHLGSVYRKLDAANRTEASAHWLRRPPPEEA
jgi:two-component system nitrate/nitrite response regulator NarP